MKREIAIIERREILTDETGEYCFRDDDTGKRCRLIGFFRPWCDIFDVDIDKENKKYKRCQPCHDAEKLAREVGRNEPSAIA